MKKIMIATLGVALLGVMSAFAMTNTMDCKDKCCTTICEKQCKTDKCCDGKGVCKMEDKTCKAECCTK